VPPHSVDERSGCGEVGIVGVHFVVRDCNTLGRVGRPITPSPAPGEWYVVGPAEQGDRVLETRIVTDVQPDERTPPQVASAFRALLRAGVRIRPAGAARAAPMRLLADGYTPKHRFGLFGNDFYLTNLREDANFRFFVAYVHLDAENRHSDRSRFVHPRIFYKDSSLVWRSPTHYIRSDDDNWIGKGDLKCTFQDGEEIEYSAEETTNLPLEMQPALDVISRRSGGVRRDLRAIDQVLRRAPDGRFEPYRDFTEPRRAAMSDPANLVNRGENVAVFERPNDPESLRFVPGFEPDFGSGVIEVSEIRSRLYGGAVRKFRIVSRNRMIQYQFVAAPRQVWIVPPQTLTTELMSYGLRTVDVNVDEDLCVPGYEYHYIDDSEDPPELVSQIPEGFAGAASDVDPSRADASAWIERLPVVREFRRRVLGERRK